MASHGELHVPGYRPFRKGGWGVAIFICALTAALWITAWVVHRNTYLHPRDHRFQAIGAERAHSAPPAGHEGGAAGAAGQSHGGH